MCHIDLTEHTFAPIEHLFDCDIRHRGVDLAGVRVHSHFKPARLVGLGRTPVRGLSIQEIAVVNPVARIGIRVYIIVIIKTGIKCH